MLDHRSYLPGDGLEYRLVGEPDPVWAANLRWLAGYRHSRFGDPGLEEHLVSSAAPGFQTLDAVSPRRVPQDGRLAALDMGEQERGRWLEGHLIELKTGLHPERPPRDAYDTALHDTEDRERAKLAEFEAAGRPMTRRHLQRLRRAYREEGLIGRTMFRSA